jgi:hypothetical protein
MRETRTSGSEGGGAHALPTPIMLDTRDQDSHVKPPSVQSTPKFLGKMFGEFCEFCG